MAEVEEPVSADVADWFSPLALGVVAAPALAGALLLLEAPMEASTFSLSFTLRTPGMASAICTARLRSSSDATLPLSFTSPLFFTLTLTLAKAGSLANWVCTLLCRASSWAFILFCSASRWSCACRSAVMGSFAGGLLGLVGSPGCAVPCEASGTPDGGGCPCG